MATAQATLVLRHVRNLVAAEQSQRQPDRELLERFTAEGEERAFEMLVRRHGPLVLGVCRRVLGNWHDAEDAFQATFLVLARKAGAIAKQDSIGSWLYQVAYHMAIRAKHRAKREWHGCDSRGTQASRATPASDPLAEVSARELLAVVDEEVQQLPERYRAAVVLCYLEGQTRDQAAQQLGWSLSTLQRRLEEARNRLRRRLERRGVALSAG